MRVGMVSRVSSPRREPSHRRRRQPPRVWRALAAVAVLVLAVVGVWQGWQYWQAHRLTLRFAGLPANGIELTFFPDQLAFAAPSPPPALGQLTIADGDSATVGGELVPEQAVVRYAAAGAGTGYRHVRLGQPSTPIELRRPGSLRGTVVEPIGIWSYGWRCAELRPVADAEVVVMGGGEHGVDLATARTAADGTFVVEGFDRQLDGLGLRVRAPGFQLEHQALPRELEAAASVALQRALPIRGQIVAVGGLDPRTLRVLARGMPGVEATPAADGSFVLDHLPPGLRPRLLLHGLPSTLAHASAHAEPGVRIELVAAAAVRGTVVDAETRAPLAAALVFCGDDHAVRADDAGQFELGQLPPGAATLEAKFEFRQGRRRIVRTGSLVVQLRAGQTLDHVLVPVD
jgi:hypothetical protein